MVAYVGSEDQGKLFLDLNGIALPAVTTTAVDLGKIVENLIKNIENTDQDATEPQPSSQPYNASDGYYGSGDSLSPAEAIARMYPDIKDMPFGANMLLFIGHSKEVSLAITGALLTALFDNLNNVTKGGVPDIILDIPVFDSLKVGYSEKDDLAGILLVLDEYKSFKINYSFGECKSFMRTQEDIYDFIDPIDPENEAREKEYDDINIIEK